MLNKNEILEKLKEILVNMDDKNAAYVDKINADTKLLTDLGLSSVGILYMVIAVEETFGVEFNNDKPLVTVGEVVDYIEANAK